ncbi:hypothetical protein KKH23_07765 [Patescibacteria group bacterium]|nr:hypothetical protein [Patescibacteria group bacterium]
MERQTTIVARRLLAMIKENWKEPWLRDLLKTKVEDPPISEALIPEILEEMALLARLKT